MPGTAGYRVWGRGRRTAACRREEGLRKNQEERNGGGGPPTLGMGRPDHPGRGRMLKMKEWRSAARPAEGAEPGD